MYPIYEFLPWNNCKNSCAFCHQKANKNKYPEKFLTAEEKLKSLKQIREFFSTKISSPFFHILFMGGELFDTELPHKVQNELQHLANDVVEKMNNGTIGLCYLNTNLIYSDLSLLISFLDIFAQKNLEHRVKFTTSYDVAYRYKSIKDRYLVEENMLNICYRYPRMPKVANSILTDLACDFFFVNPNFLEKFTTMYGFEINLIPYICLHKNIAPCRKSIHNLLMKLEATYPGFLNNYVRNLSLSQEHILWEFNGKELVNVSSNNAECGHSVNFQKVYADDTRCFICDCINLFKTLFN